MKKSLLALAVLSAFAGAASAQSSVTLSGSVDLGVRRTLGQWDMATAGSSRTNFTLSGAEDLGGGMKAVFVLNHRFNANNGTQADVGRFYRQSWVGLSGGFGEVLLGRRLGPLQSLSFAFDPWQTNTVGSVWTGGIKTGVNNSRYNNQIFYSSPNLGGLTVTGMIAAADENGGAERPIGFGVNYGAGPLRVAMAYDRNGTDLKTLGFYGSYNMGVATLMGAYEKGDVSAVADVKRWSVGADVPMGAVTFKAGYTRWTDEDLKKFGLGLEYNLSKRTRLYTDLGKISGNGSAVGATAAARNLNRKAKFDVGIWHNF